MKLRDHLLRSPDVSFIRWDSVLDPEEIINPRTGWCNYPPDLAVEVLSPSNTEKEMRIKLDEYVRAGVKIVWIVDPERQEVDVYTRPRFIAAKTYRLDDHLDGGKVLPGFILRVSDIFKTPTPPKKAKKNGR
jgi:Uma2 family endonuclease